MVEFRAGLVEEFVTHATPSAWMCIFFFILCNASSKTLNVRIFFQGCILNRPPLLIKIEFGNLESSNEQNQLDIIGKTPSRKLKYLQYKI